MVRRAALILVSLALLGLAGCAYGTEARLTPAQEQARKAFIRAHDAYNDRDLARLCPGLYPRDFLTDHDQWRAGEARAGDLTSRQIATARARQAAQIRAAACDVYPG
ncbi:MAG TPA: hypothetical protein VF250_15460 [Conexibacter sp.]